MIATAVYLVGDPSPIYLRLTPEQVACRLLDAEVQAEKVGLDGHGFARFEGRKGPILVRPRAVAMFQAVEVDVPDEDD